MFPEVLSTELLSLGAKEESYAVSCGVTLDDEGRVTSYEVCPSKITVTRRLSYNQLDDLLSQASLFGLRRDLLNSSCKVSTQVNDSPLHCPPVSKSDMKVISDLSKLDFWAKVRHVYRIRNGALDIYLRDKTELSLFVRRTTIDGGSRGYAGALKPGALPQRYTVIGNLFWSNTTSSSLVTEYMVLMCQTIGKLCVDMQVPVW